ncbi:FtsW/RodA/SpoVE family cell cycle protein [Roseiflexus castenholzii]|uniref:Cell cycle protein n=2 Tax=Roseiflexus castenholzii TaxID=120962 RepID=A7NJR9_ROSCS|nr:FtsW/RodA/SpoVE family cell cycle protein [Roseiflexus castenholzii]ABU57739.1 cell cycle protein [Roseiflexus castenholzii DSM 13941]
MPFSVQHLTMFRRPWRLRSAELRLLLIALVFFAAGYTLVALAGADGPAASTTIQGVARILWPSILPFLLFLALSLGLSWRLPGADQMVLPLVALLTGLGLMVIARLEPDLLPIKCQQRDGTLAPCFAGIDDRQALWVLLGIAICAIVLFIPWDDLLRRYQRTSLMDWLDHHRYAWLTAGVALILATFLFGVDPNNSGVRAWFNFGFFLFQPSELLKIVLVIFLASYLNEHREVVAAGYRIGPLPLPPLPYLVPLIAMWGLAMGLIIAQRDLGAALLLFSVFLAMLYVATGRGWYVVAGLCAFGAGSYVLYTIVAVVKTRVSIWLDPWATAQGSGYQIVQAIYALASGGVLGTGLGQGLPTVIPAVHTDFVFTALAEEMGLAGSLAVLVAYLLLIFRGYAIAIRIPGRFRGFEQLLAVGLTTILAAQTFIIIGGNLRVIPLTGITLPFISYGGSSVIMNFLIIGLLLRISASAPTPAAEQP